MERVSRDNADGPVFKKARLTPANPEELKKGTRVIYNSDQPGVIKDAWVPIDEFWVEDLETGQLVRDVEGDVIAFKSEQLRLMPKESEPAELPREAMSSMPVGNATASRAKQGSAARVLVLAKEEGMVQMLEHFGVPCYEKRLEPQLMLAVPVTHCRCSPSCKRFDPWCLDMCSPDDCPITQLAVSGSEDDHLQDLATRLRPDIEVRARVFHLKQAIEQIGPDLRSLDGYFCLSAVTLPYGQEDINEVVGDERKFRQEVRCQIDLGVSALGSFEASDGSLEMTARRALREFCRVDIAPPLWTAQEQFRLRQKLGVDLPLKFWDCDTQVFVIILPDDLVSCVRGDGVLSFQSPAGAGDDKGRPEVVKDIAYWKLHQDEFRHLGRLPKPWFFIRSATDKDIIYFYNTETGKTSAEPPLPPGWTQETSKSTGKRYYFHTAKKKSSFVLPLPAGWTEETSKTTGKSYFFHAGMKKSSFEYPPME